MVNSTLGSVQMPRLVVFDVDGTLIGADGHLHVRTRAALDGLRARRVPIALATGRPMVVAAATLEQVGGADWMACSNGSVVFETATGRLLRDRCLPDDVVEPVVTGLRRRVPGIRFAIELSHTMIEEHGFARRVPEAYPGPSVDDALEVLRASPAMVRRLIPFHDDYDHRLADLATIVEEFIDDRCAVHFGGLPIVDIAPSGDHKAIALEELIRHLGIDRSEVLAFGDGLNDVQMLTWAGTGVAMGGADPRVHDAADHVTDDVAAFGVARFLEPLLASWGGSG